MSDLFKDAARWHEEYAKRMDPQSPARKWHKDIAQALRSQTNTDKDGYPFGGTLLDRLKGVATGSWQLHPETASKIVSEIVRLRNKCDPKKTFD